MASQMKTNLFAVAVLALFVDIAGAQGVAVPGTTPQFNQPTISAPGSIPNLPASQQQVPGQFPPAIQQPVPGQFPPAIQQPVPGQFPPAIQQPIPGQFPPAIQYPNQTPIQQPDQGPPVLTKSHLRDIDGLVVQLSNYTRQMHDEYHLHFQGERHAEKLDVDVTALEGLADALHAFAVSIDGSAQSVARLRNDTNEFIQLSVRISRTIDLTEPWLRTAEGTEGVRHMREIARGVTGVALQIDRYLPVDVQVIDNQAERLEAAVKELHDEFHEHLEGYEVSQHLDEDLEEVETLVEHMHGLAHNRSWQQIDFGHLMQDTNEIRQKTAHIESLFVQQAGIGVRSQDWIGIEHARDAITDVLSSAYLLEHMVRKSNPAFFQPPIEPNLRPNVPLRDRHGHAIRNPNFSHDQQRQMIPQYGQPQYTQPQYAQPQYSQPQNGLPGGIQ